MNGCRYPVGYLMVLYCTALHLVWAGLLLLNNATAGATPVSALQSVFPTPLVLELTLVTAAVLAGCALRAQLPWAVVFMLPQQLLLLISACGAVTAVVAAQYADGVVRPRSFIAADQAHIILAAVGHAIAIVFSSRAKVSGNE